jgi:hypothetical protein
MRSWKLLVSIALKNRFPSGVTDPSTSKGRLVGPRLPSPQKYPLRQPSIWKRPFAFLLLPSWGARLQLVFRSQRWYPER